MKKILLFTSLFLFVISCTKEVDSPALLSQVSTLQGQVATLQGQVAAGSTLQTQLNTKSAELTAAVANYNASQASLTESLAAYSILEEAYVELSVAYNEIQETVNNWFYNAEGVYQFYVTNNGVRVADYVWDLGTTPNSNGNDGIYGIPYFEEYISNGTCYSLSTATSLNQEARTYISQASFNDLAIWSYDLAASNYSIFDINLNYEFVYQKVTITRFSTGIYVLIAWYDTSFNLIGTLGNLSNSSPLAPLTQSQVNTISICN